MPQLRGWTSAALLAAAALLPAARAPAGDAGGGAPQPQGYRFEAWGGKQRTPYAVFHWNLDLPRLLGDEYRVVSHFGRMAGGADATWLAYDEVRLVRKGDARAGNADTPVYGVSYYECADLVSAHKTLISAMQAGAGRPPPDRCLPGVDVGDQCFTGWATQTPTSIYFARGNVALAVTGPTSVLRIAERLDRMLVGTFPGVLGPARVKQGKAEGKAAIPPGPAGLSRLVANARPNASLSVWSSKGALRLDDKGGVRLTSADGEDVEVLVIQSRRLAVRPR